MVSLSALISVLALLQVCHVSTLYARRVRRNSLEPEELLIETETGAECNLPFTYGKQTYSACTVVASPGKPWCYINSEQIKWDYCVLEEQDADAKPQATIGGSGKGENCVFPFDYKNILYHSCTEVDSAGKPWCDTPSGWGYCVAEEKVVKVIQTTGGNGKGENCKLPFVYKGVTNYDCTEHASAGKPWCYTAQPRKWGYCVVNPGCDDSPCRNDGTCTNLDSGKYTCQCKTYYKGDNCETRKQPCEVDPCENGADCVDIDIYRYTCTCTNGYTGNLCQIAPAVSMDQAVKSAQLQSDAGRRAEPDVRPINPVVPTPCSTLPCKNGGTCIDVSDNKFECKCKVEFGGNQCQTKKAIYMGCFIDNTNAVRDLVWQKKISATGMTNLVCFQNCRGFRYAATQGSTDCYCGNVYGSQGLAPVTDCDTPCSGDEAQTCGGTDRNSIYQVNLRDPCSTTKKKCLNGECVNKGNRADCRCNLGYIGNRCQKQKNNPSGKLPCDENECLNDSVCYNQKLTRYACVCQTHFSGSKCEKTPKTKVQ